VSNWEGRIIEIPIVSTRYWNMVHGVRPEDVQQDTEGLFPMKELGKNMAYLLRCQEAGRNAGVEIPEQEMKPFTNFIR